MVYHLGVITSLGESDVVLQRRLLSVRLYAAVLTLKRHCRTADLCGLAAGRRAVVFVGELVASSLTASAACLIGSGVGQERVSGGLPPGSGVRQPVEDERGFVVKILLTVNGSVSGPGGLGALVGDPGFSERLEGDGVAAAFGEEMAAEPQHVRPAGQVIPSVPPARASMRRE